MSFPSLQTSIIHETSQVSAGCQEQVGLFFGSARESFSRLSVLPESDTFTSCTLPAPLDVKGRCLCTLGNILDVGAEGSVQGGDMGAVDTVVQKDVGAFGNVDQNDVVAFGTVDQKDVVAAGTDRKCWFCPGKESVSAGSQQSSVISPGLKVSDPMLEVGDGRCAGDIPPSPGVPRHASTSIPRVVQFRQARCLIPR